MSKKFDDALEVVLITVADRLTPEVGAALNDLINEHISLEEQRDRLMARGIQDMQFEIQEQKDTIENLELDLRMVAMAWARWYDDSLSDPQWIIDSVREERVDGRLPED